MKTYFGTKKLNAKPMTLGEYNTLRGWTIPDNEDPNREGYLVEYLDGASPSNLEGFTGYVSWTPKEPFEKAYHEYVSGDLLSTYSRHTVIHTDKPVEFGYHNYLITNPDTGLLASIHFQTGPIKEHGVNGIQNEDLLNIVIHRLQFFQHGKFACEENDMAITKLKEALLWLNKRTTDRELRNVEGTNLK